MTWYAWLMVSYFAIDRLLTVAWIGRSVEITRSYAVAALISGAMLVWGIVALAGGS